MTGKARLNLEISKEQNTQLKLLREDTGAASIVEVIRRALKLYTLLHAHSRAGGKIVLREADGVERTVVLL